jgi:hypothetical protein
MISERNQRALPPSLMGWERAIVPFLVERPQCRLIALVIVKQVVRPVVGVLYSDNSFPNRRFGII